MQLRFENAKKIDARPSPLSRSRSFSKTLFPHRDTPYSLRRYILTYSKHVPPYREGGRWGERVARRGVEGEGKPVMQLVSALYRGGPSPRAVPSSPLRGSLGPSRCTWCAHRVPISMQPRGCSSLVCPPFACSLFLVSVEGRAETPWKSTANRPGSIRDARDPNCDVCVYGVCQNYRRFFHLTNVRSVSREILSAAFRVAEEILYLKLCSWA